MDPIAADGTRGTFEEIPMRSAICANDSSPTRCPSLTATTLMDRARARLSVIGPLKSSSKLRGAYGSPPMFSR